MGVEPKGLESLQFKVDFIIVGGQRFVILDYELI